MIVHAVKYHYIVVNISGELDVIKPRRVQPGSRAVGILGVFPPESVSPGGIRVRPLCPFLLFLGWVFDTDSFSLRSKSPEF